MVLPYPDINRRYIMAFFNSLAINMVKRFTNAIANIKENNEFFNIDYNDLISNFDKDIDTGKEKITMMLTIQNIAFLDFVRGDISRTKFLDKIITIFRNEFVESVKNDINNEGDKLKNDGFH